MKKLVKIAMCILLLSFAFLLSSCTSTSIQSYSDELVESVWYAELENGTQIMLSFKDVKATLEIKQNDGEKMCINGFCEVSDSIFVIYDESTKTPYAFEYIVQFDRVNVKILTNTVSLYKT